MDEFGDVTLTSSAQKDVRALPIDIRSRVLSAIDRGLFLFHGVFPTCDESVENALTGNLQPRGVMQLKGADDLYRMKIGAHRVVYMLDYRGFVVVIIRVRHRRDVYRNLPQVLQEEDRTVQLEPGRP
jgi:mRNA interferase RelE/StbE